MKKMFVRILCVLLICTLLCASALSEVISPDLSGMSIEELLSMQEKIDALLEEKGYRAYFDIERGAKGEDVLAIQNRLSELGYYSGNQTGKYDSETQKAFKWFEKANGLKNDGLASREDQIVLFSDAAVSKAVPEPQPDASTVPSDKVDEKKEHDVSFDYEQCMRYPDAHIGESYTLKGKVEQTLGSRSSGFKIRLSVLGNSDEIIYVYINYDPGYNILENDWLIVDVTMNGTVTYQSIWGQKITIPSAFASNVTLRK